MFVLRRTLLKEQLINGSTFLIVLSDRFYFKWLISLRVNPYFFTEIWNWILLMKTSILIIIIVSTIKLFSKQKQTLKASSNRNEFLTWSWSLKFFGFFLSILSSLTNHKLSFVLVWDYLLSFLSDGFNPEPLRLRNSSGFALTTTTTIP